MLKIKFIYMIVLILLIATTQGYAGSKVDDMLAIQKEAEQRCRRLLNEAVALQKQQTVLNASLSEQRASNDSLAKKIAGTKTVLQEVLGQTEQLRQKASDAQQTFQAEQEKLRCQAEKDRTARTAHLRRELGDLRDKINQLQLQRKAQLATNVQEQQTFEFNDGASQVTGQTYDEGFDDSDADAFNDIDVTEADLGLGQ